MNRWNPRWTKPGSWTLGRDPLGMQATSVRLYRSLVPGLTNVTNRLRYYSFYCWVVAAFERTKHADDLTRWAVFIRRAEALYALACQLHDAEGAYGLGGGDWATERRKKLPGRRLSIRQWTDHPEPDPPVKQYLAAKRGNFGQFYIASMLEVGLLAHSRGVPLVSNDRGRAAADAFEKSVGNAIAILEAGILTGAVEIEDLKALGPSIHPSEIPRGSTEMGILRAFLLDENAEWVGAKRRESAWLVLDLMRKVGKAFDVPSLRNVVYNRVLPDGSPYQGRDEDTIDGWQAYQANELCHISLSAFLNGLVWALDRKGGEGEPGPIVDALVSQIFSPLGRTKPWRAWADEVGTQWQGKEEELAEQVLEAISDRENAGTIPGLVAAAQLLATLSHRWGSGKNGVRQQVTKAVGDDLPSVAQVLETLAAAATETRESALAKVISRHVIADHLAIAGRKLASGGTFTYHFTLIDGRIADGLSGEYGYTNPRLGNLINFLGDAGLHEDWKPTSDGRKFLNGR